MAVHAAPQPHGGLPQPRRMPLHDDAVEAAASLLSASTRQLPLSPVGIDSAAVSLLSASTRQLSLSCRHDSAAVSLLSASTRQLPLSCRHRLGSCLSPVGIDSAAASLLSARTSVVGTSDIQATPPARQARFYSVTAVGCTGKGAALGLQGRKP
jgi:hypothetical protein